MSTTKPTHTPLTYLKSVAIGTANMLIANLYPSLRPYLPTSPTHLNSKTAIVTGGNSGIGLQIAKDLAQLGATVTLACRNTTKGQTAVDEILRVIPAAKGRVDTRQLDTSSLESVRAFAKGFIDDLDEDGRVDILVNNAGIASLPPGTGGEAVSEFSGEGFEVVYATNFLGSFLLTSLLEDRMADNARVVFTSSFGNYGGKIGSGFSTGQVKGVVEEGFHTLGSGNSGRATARYGMTKSMQVAFAKSLQAKWDGEAARGGYANKRVAHSFTPGYTVTEIFGKYEHGWKQEPVFAAIKAWTMIATHVSEGAATGSWLASTDDKKVIGSGLGGGYWDRMVRRTSTADMFGQEVLDRLWVRWEADASVEWRY